MWFKTESGVSRISTFTSLRRGRLFFLSLITAPQVLFRYLGVAATRVVPVPQSQLLLEPAQALLLLVQVLLVKELALAVDHKRMLLLLLFQYGRRCRLRMMWEAYSILLLLHMLLLAVGKAQVNWRAKKPGIELYSRSYDGPGRDRAVPNPGGEVAAAAGCGGGAVTGGPRLLWRQTTVVATVSPAPSQQWFQRVPFLAHRRTIVAFPR